MEQITKMNTAGFIDFNYEVENETYRKRLAGYTATKTWDAIITKYQTCKEFNRNFFDFVDNQVEVAWIKTVDVIKVFVLTSQITLNLDQCRALCI